VKEQSVEMSPGSQTGYTIFLEDAERKEIDDIVKDLFGEVQKKPDI
jgi:S-ribosylhomocysteine lyase LuxS involved in autoinducer biosynthesis